MFHDFFLKNWFDLLQTIFILVGFAFSYITLRNDIRANRFGHLLQLTQSYREIWAKTYDQPELNRIRRADVDLVTQPITEAEQRLVKELIMHIAMVYEAIRNDQIDEGGTRKDIAEYMLLPIPNAVWQEVKEYQSKQFVSYIDGLLR